MKPFDRRPSFWIAYTLLAIASLAASWWLFPQAIPIVNLDVTMTRESAIAEARALAARYGLAPADARAAAVFNQDGLAQNYVELEGGGKEAFARLVEGKAYAPYWWEVRLFRLGSIEEATVRFRPGGTRDGFSRRVPEAYVRDPATKALDAAAALALARERATADWQVDFGAYRLLDQSQQTRPSGRVDHEFVFEREGAIGEARIRLVLEVRGDELTEVEPRMHVPESFLRRFAEMRSANTTISSAASIVAGLLYGLVGVVIAGLLLLRAHALEVRRSLVAGLMVGGLMGAALLAHAPAAWFAVPTTQTEANFWLRQVGTAAGVTVGGGLLLGAVFMAAEGLTRRAFPHHPQLWKVWSRGAAPTPEIAGRTAGGYLFVPVELAFIALFYAITNRYLGWWQPSEQLTDPNILASAVPALSPIAMALQAGMMEECLFRGVPLALGAIVGARYGRRGLGIAIAFVLQAVVFGAAHANYPGLPSYSRLVELVLPSLAWAAIFLRYGLLPVILLHALFNLVLMSIPLFLVDAQGATLQRVVVLLAGLLPLLVVLGRRVQAGAWHALPQALRNGAWQGRVVAPVAAEAPVVMVADRGTARFARALPVLGAIGAVLWVACTPTRADAPAMAIDRGQAIAAAEAALAGRGVDLGPAWRRSAVPRSALDDPVQRQWHTFVWKEAGADAYRALVGNALAPPLWDVRFARFDGDVALRAEEWRITVAGDGKVRQVVHRLPEGRAGASLSREEAQALAQRTLREELGVDPSVLAPRAAEEVARPARRDWVFSFADPAVKVGGQGESRVQVAIAGDDIASAGRSMFVPEAWQRAESTRHAERGALRIAAFGTLALAGIAALVLAMIAWARGRSDRRALVRASAFVFVLALVAGANNWPVQAFALNTTDPVASQLAMTALSGLAGAIAIALLVGLFAGVAAHYASLRPAADLGRRLPSWAYGVLAALAVAGISAAIGAAMPDTAPTWPDHKAAAGLWPWVAPVVAGLAFVPALALTGFLLSLFDRLTSGWSRRVVLVAVLLVLLGVAAAIAGGQDLLPALAAGGAQGATMFAVVWLLLRHDLRCVPAFVATGLVLDAVRATLLAGTTAAWIACALTAGIAAALAWKATTMLRARD
jgi:hypothetical protein